MTKRELELRSLRPVHYVLIFTNLSIADGSGEMLSQSINLADKFTTNIALFGFIYMIECYPPPTGTGPIISILMSRAQLTSDPWTNTGSQVRFDSTISVGSHNDFPAKDQTWMRRPWILKFSDTLTFGVYVYNMTGSQFTSNIRIHFTMMYKEL